MLAVGWIPTDGWRWASDSETTIKGEEYLAAYPRWLQVAERDGPRWLLPVGAPKWVRIRPASALRAFLQLGVGVPQVPDAWPPLLRDRILTFAGRYGWLGRSRLLTLTNGGGEVRGELLGTWVHELALLGGVSQLLDACERVQRSDARPSRAVMADRVGQLTEAATVAGLTLSPAARPDDLIREARRGARALLAAELRGQFSARLLDSRGAPVERYVPLTLAATLALEVARRAGRSDPSRKPLRSCRTCRALFEPKRSDAYSCSDRCRYAYRDAKKPRPRGRAA